MSNHPTDQPSLPTSIPEGPTISAREFLKILVQNPQRIKAIDVRSETEADLGQIEAFLNMPILSNLERHLVGMSYKENGQDAAMKLGFELVSPHRDQLVKKWTTHLSGADMPIVMCWRGGLRSKIAASWLNEAGLQVIRIQGGYKSLRNELLLELAVYPEFLVVGGATGTGKTKLLLSAGVPALDLEGLAVHKGSAFGKDLKRHQPSQATFENQIAFQFLRDRKKRLIVEDESLVIGKVHLPVALKDQMRASPTVKIQMTIEDRVTNIFDDYITAPLEAGISARDSEAYYQESLGKIKNKLGGLKEAELRSAMKDAFIRNDIELHRFWIRELLTLYYDRTYDFAFNKTPRNIAFEGDWKTCQTWIQNQYA